MTLPSSLSLALPLVNDGFEEIADLNMNQAKTAPPRLDGIVPHPKARRHAQLREVMRSLAGPLFRAAERKTQPACPAIALATAEVPVSRTLDGKETFPPRHSFRC